jgi:hypothetical protein
MALELSVIDAAGRGIEQLQRGSWRRNAPAYLIYNARVAQYVVIEPYILER